MVLASTAQLIEGAVLAGLEVVVFVGELGRDVVLEVFCCDWVAQITTWFREIAEPEAKPEPLEGRHAALAGTDASPTKIRPQTSAKVLYFTQRR